VIIFRVVATLAGLFFVVAVVLMAAPWVLLQPDQQTSTELNRWFLTVAGSVDAIAAGMLLAHSRAKQHWSLDPSNPPGSPAPC
jgi:peptidoglycan/LPS O-acetylase OafA/YrhL